MELLPEDKETGLEDNPDLTDKGSVRPHWGEEQTDNSSMEDTGDFLVPEKKEKKTHSLIAISVF